MSRTAARLGKEELEKLEEDTADASEIDNILHHQPDWRALANSGRITQQESGIILDYEAAEDKATFLDDPTSGPALAKFFVRAVDRITERDTIRYLLTLVDKMLEIEGTERPPYALFTDLNPYPAFRNILQRSVGDSYSVLKAVHILAVLLSTRGAQESDELEKLINWMVANASKFSQKDQVSLLVSLKELLKMPLAQYLFATKGGLRILNAWEGKKEKTESVERKGRRDEADPKDLAGNFQWIYTAGFCLWLLSFNKSPEVMKELQKYEIIRRIAEILPQAKQEKVVRMCFNILRNLVQTGEEVISGRFIEEMIGHGLNKTVQSLLQRANKYKDPDLLINMNLISDVLTKAIEKLSSFEMYLAELTSNNLTRSPVHSEQFWSEHKLKFEERNFDLIKKLVDLVAKSPSELTQEIACYDLGEFARFHPEGKQIILKLGGKTPLMQRMKSPNVKVAKQALLAVQKLLVNNWEFLSRGSGGSSASGSSKG